ncbi:MAG: hypothetical protein ACK46X_16795 [Candidatus Sericytochromatia bacterium]
MTKPLWAALAVVLALAGPAEARLGATAEQASRHARSHGASLTGATFYLKAGRVVSETLEAGETPMTRQAADKLRAQLVGARRLTATSTAGSAPSFVYADGTRVTYQLDGTHRVILIEATVGRYAKSPVSEYDGYTRIDDFKHQPWRGRPW